MLSLFCKLFCFCLWTFNISTHFVSYFFWTFCSISLAEFWHDSYASTLCFAGDHNDLRPLDYLRRRKRRIVAIDALCNPRMREFKIECIVRYVVALLSSILSLLCLLGYIVVTFSKTGFQYNVLWEMPFKLVVICLYISVCLLWSQIWTYICGHIFLNELFIFLS